MKFLAAVALTFLAIASPALAAGAPAKPAAAKRIVLPTDVRPDRYDIHLAPNAEALTFKGVARIDLTVVRPTDRIVLNAADLTFGKVSLSGQANAPRIVLDEEQQTAAFVFPTALAPGKYTLSIDYAGKIYQQASGLFALDYENADGSKHRALFTQFENSDARRFAPMWDEPGVKAVFALTVEAPDGQMAVSNMPEEEVITSGRPSDPLAANMKENLQRRAPGAPTTHTVRFAVSPKMSSYLLFLALGDFERIHSQVGKTDVGVVVRKGDAAKGQYALDAAVKLLTYYDDWFDTPYPLPKLDLVAGPGNSQFFSAMENWGAIFYFDSALLIDPKISTETDRQNVFITIAHEMAHQWFGDLVTMDWWDDLWLNEGFASWMENKATDHFHPEWNVWLLTQSGQQSAMRLDSRAGAHPVIADIPDVFAAANAFDSITYQKGQAVIRMLETYVGEDAFKAGVRSYIKQHAYKNAVSGDLWTALDKAAPTRRVADVAHDFLLQPGVPLIQATETAGGIALTQSRFGVDESQRAPQTWRTPVNVQGPNGQVLEVVSAKAPKTVPLGAPVIVNSGQTGYFRSAYSPALWAKLAPTFPKLTAANQLGLLYDSRALGEAGVAPMSDFLALARNTPADADPIVLDTLSSQLGAIDGLYGDRPGQAAYRDFARAQLAPIAARLGWDAKAGEADNDAVTRRGVLTTLGELHDGAVVAEARKRFAAWVKDPASLSGAGRSTVLAIVAANADAPTWEAIHAMAKASKDPTDRSRLYGYLGASDDPALANKALALALSGEPSPTQVPGIVAAVAQGFPDKAYDFAMVNRTKLEAFLEPASRITYFAELAQASRDPAMLRKLATLKATVPASTKGEIEKAEAAIRNRLDVIQARVPEMDRWLAANRG
ncbi:MAG: M1 family metallopeptidase [Alphaproteobacteria bacterium]|nr:M1 family metallopeptidase [Alphaproteobacteria bacterium]MBU1515918.1 M1 family metallopeptidase [Alphaproteobacteria bacterium]MBU2094140.1 M1 family metallopeptidase [Alphaproteobacteria bacterium]MBU2151492.1 M1 family metallopeptidase [Alphaproteobacteria bacterium]MBU2305232.1 M1 family metallopeptidase [Alphaproteobacteria bacterium]